MMETKEKNIWQILNPFSPYKKARRKHKNLLEKMDKLNLEMKKIEQERKRLIYRER
jgi:hypothetical protein